MRNLLLVLLFISEFELSAQPSGLEKCSPLLHKKVLSERADGDWPALYTIQVKDVASFKNAMLPKGVRVLSEYLRSGVLLVESPADLFLSTILPRTDLLFADVGMLAGEEEIIVPGHNLFTNQIRRLQSKHPELDGKGVVISVKEFGFDTVDVDFRNRIISNNKQILETRIHASLMATLAAGAGNADPAGGGVARGSRLYSSSFAGLLPDDDQDYELNKITVQNHSYGSGIQNYYGANALAYDQTTLDHPELVHVFSAGNEGGKTAPTGTYVNVPGFANLTGNYKMAKNVLTVGAVDSFNNVLFFSSAGPAYDGRLKPDLVAYGTDGTSGAAALVSGAAAVVQQAFLEKQGYWPGSDLVKAILIGSVDDLRQPGPDFLSGYGNLNLFKAVELVEKGILETGTVGAGETRTFELNTPSSQKRNLIITLYWNDLPAPPNAPKALVNDLDIQLITPDGSIVLPWVLQSQPDGIALALPADRGVDTLNNTEQIYVQDAAPGSYIVEVTGSRVSGNQSFAIAVGWDTLPHFAWTCPVKNDPFTAGKEVVLRWETNNAAQKGRIEWRPVNAANWLEIDNAVILNSNIYRWLAPDTFTAAQVRMVADGEITASDTFLISPVVRVQVGFNCPDSLLISWESMATGAQYRVWGLGDQYLEPLLMTSDTVIVLQKNTYPQQRFAVSAISSDGAGEGPLSSAPDINTQGAGCYINNFFALLNAEEQVDLKLRLGSLYGVENVQIQKWEQQEWRQLATAFPDSLQLLFVDPAPSPGVNSYQAALAMENGGTIIGEPVFINFTGAEGTVFPNPTSSGIISILYDVADEPRRFILRDAPGKIVLEKTLEDLRTDLSIQSLPPGCYWWEVVGADSKRLSAGKIFIIR